MAADALLRRVQQQAQRLERCLIETRSIQPQAMRSGLEQQLVQDVGPVGALIAVLVDRDRAYLPVEIGNPRQGLVGLDCGNTHNRQAGGVKPLALSTCLPFPVNEHHTNRRT